MILQKSAEQNVIAEPGCFSSSLMSLDGEDMSIKVMKKHLSYTKKRRLKENSFLRIMGWVYYVKKVKCSPYGNYKKQKIIIY